jgi:hypothetical protein
MTGGEPIVIAYVSAPARPGGLVKLDRRLVGRRTILWRNHTGL